jgi:hypothetical protein
MQKLETLIKQLPPELQEEVKDFVEFLIKRHNIKAGRKLRQDYRDKYTSLELQKKALEWRGD